MNYRQDKYGNELSVLGFGCMRFSRKLGMIDMEKAEKQIMTAFKNGVNYFDTAYIYPGSEAALGEIFEKNGIRDKVYFLKRQFHMSEIQYFTHIRPFFSLPYVSMAASKKCPTARNLLHFRCNAVLKEKIFVTTRQKSAEIRGYFNDF